MDSVILIQVLILVLTHISCGENLDYSYHDVHYEDPSPLDDIDSDILEMLDALDYRDRTEIDKYNQVLDDILGPDVLEDKLRADFMRLMADPMLSEISLAKDQDGALRLREYILSEKSSIIKKSLPDAPVRNDDLFQLDYDGDDLTAMDIANQSADNQPLSPILLADSEDQAADAESLPSDSEGHSGDEVDENSDEQAQQADQADQLAKENVQPVDEEAESADGEVQSADAKADDDEGKSSEEEAAEADEEYTLKPDSSEEDRPSSVEDNKLLEFEITYGLARFGGETVKNIEIANIEDLYEDIPRDESGPLVMDDDGVDTEAQWTDLGLNEMEGQGSEGRGSGNIQHPFVYFESLSKEVRVLEAVFYLGLCGGVALLAFGCVACALGLLRVRRTMQEQLSQQEKLKEVKTVKMGNIVKSYARLPLDIKTGRPSHLAYSELYSI